MPDYKHYQLRIHQSWEDISGVIISLAKKADKGFAFQHNADTEVSRTHCHIYLFDLNLKYDAISDRIKKLGLKGNTDFSISGACGESRRPLDVSGAWIYGTKCEQLRSVWVQNISPAIVEELSEGARRFYAKGNKTTPAASVIVKAKPNKYQQVKEIAANCLTPEFLKLGMSDRIKSVRDEVIEYMRLNCIFADSKRIVEYIECVMLDLDDESLKQAVNRRLNWIYFGEK